jgi:hypothetical protein
VTRTKVVLKHWLPIAAVTTILCLLVYATAQQALRNAADDPQIQLAEDAAGALARDAAASSVVPPVRIDIARSLAPFMIVLDDKGGVVATSGLLHGQAPAIPPGVLEFARAHGEHRVTLQPERGVRIASVVLAHGGATPGFVVAGRSLRETERRVAQLVTFVTAAWLGALAISLMLLSGGEVLAPSVRVGEQA